MALTKATTNVVNLDKDTLINGLTVGKGSGTNNSSTAVGTNALLNNTTGTNNTAVGTSAFTNNTTGFQSVAVGTAALTNNTTGAYNTANGSNALYSNTTGNSNTANGADALYSNTTGIGNSANGSSALQSNTTGSYNSANGLSALQNNTTGNNNTAVGANSLVSNTTGDNNSTNGLNALQNNTTGNNNTAVGANSLFSNTTGNNNSANGISALQSNTTFSNIGGFGHNAQVTGSNQIQLGDSATTTFAYGAVQDRSDIRDKADVRDTELGLEFVNALRPVDFKWDMREDYRPEAPEKLSPEATDEEKAAYKIAQDKWLEDVKLANITHDGSKKRNRFHHGLIAQEVKAVLDAKGIDFGGFQDHKVKGGDDVLSIGYEELIAPMIKAIQELSAKIDELQK
jgi:hypothetical protein